MLWEGGWEWARLTKSKYISIEVACPPPPPPPPPPALDLGLVCLLKKLVGFNRKSVWKLSNLVGFLNVSFHVLPFVWVLKKQLDASR